MIDAESGWAARRTPTAFRNVFACLVHERLECVVDLVRNLRRLDPDSLIVLYNGGDDPRLLDCRFPFDRYGAVVHPWSRPLAWGRLHDFAFDCLRYAIDHFAFDTLTIVDSDQLATRSGYSAALAKALVGRPGVGMLGNSPGVKSPDSGLLPIETAFREIELWRPWLRRFRDGASKFVHWSFWPATVLTSDAARALVRLVDTDHQLAELLDRTEIVATEEVILPTLVALLGFEVAASPFSDDFVRFRVAYSPEEIGRALSRPDVFWVHPVARRYDDPLRQAIRSHHGHYETPFGADRPRMTSATYERPSRDLASDEAASLIELAKEALAGCSVPSALAAIGARSVGLAATLATVAPAADIFAIHPDGLTVPDVEGVRVFRVDPAEIVWGYPIGLLLFDGPRDYAELARGFFHLERWVVPGGLIAVRCDPFGDTAAFVREAVGSGLYRLARSDRGLSVLRRVEG